MFVRLLLLFTVVPLTELWLLLEIGERVGPLVTVALVIGTGVLGAALAKQQGLRALARVREELAAGGLPTEALLEGLLIFVAGAVLLTPGLLTDLFGFTLLVPWTRGAIRRAIARWLRRRFSPRGAPGDGSRVIVIEPERGPEDG